MSDVNANINISINSQQALGQLRALQNQISTFNQSVVAGNVAAVQKQKQLARDLTAQINASKNFTTSISNVETSVSRLGRAIDKNKLSLNEYFRYGIAASGKMGAGMKEHAAIMELAGERVKRLQTQYIALEKSHNGYTRSLAVRPTNLFNADSAIAIQRQQIFNRLLGDGSTALVNWGKNTQWAGRQLMVGFTVPLTIFGGVAGKIFMDLEKQVVQFKRVYGDLQTPTSERNAMVEEVKALSKEFTKYGIAVSDTVALAAKAAATGATGADLLAQTTEATRLATLGQIDYQQALDATISLQTAFGVSSKDLADATNFLNAVENQTVTSLDDITSAIPLVAPVIKGLGGDVKDLAIFLTAMREGGVSANEGANALKSGLASLINPTKAAREQLEKVGINIDSILSKNKGDLRGLVMEFGSALGTLGKFERQQTLAKMFGKYQFARLGALFSNISKEGSQAARVMDLTAMSAKELGQIAEGELGQLEEAVGVKFTAALEKLKLAIAPIGEAFLKIATPIIDFATKIADAFNNLPDAAKTFITWGAAIGGVLVPTVIMLVGLLGNFAGNMLKIGAAIGRLMGKTNGLSAGFEYLTMEELDAVAASASLEGQTNSLTTALNIQRTAVKRLASAYGNYVLAAGAAATNIPQGFGGPARKMATGGFVAGSGNKDSEPALLMPGEFVVNKEAAQKYGPVLSAMNAGTIKGYALGSEPTARTHLTPAIGVGIQEALQLDGITEGIRRKLSLLQEMSDVLGDDLVVNISKVSNLVAELPERFNLAMKDGLSQADFARDFSDAGTDKWKLTADVVGQDFEELRPHLEILDRNILEASQEFSVVGDSNIGEVVRKAFAALPQESRDMLAQIEALSTQFNNLRVTVGALGDEAAERLLRETGIGYSRGTGESSSRLTFTRNGEVVGTARTQQETSSFGSTNYRRAPLNFSGTRVAALEQARAAAAQAGEASGTAYWAAFATSLRQSGRTASQILASALAEGMNPEMAMEGIGAAYQKTTALERSMREMGLAAGGQIGPAVLEGASAASPPPWSTDLGKWIGQGIKGGMTVELSSISGIVSSSIKGAGPAFGPMASVLAGKAQEKENAEAKERLAIEAQINKEISKRALLLQRQGISAQAALDIARKEVMAEKEQLVIEEKILDTKQRQVLVPRSSEATQAAGTAVQNIANAPIVSVGKEAQTLKTRMSGFGQSLLTGSAKITGAMFALDGLVFGLSMMDNGVGEFAQKIMPVVFGLQSLQMMLPVLMTPMGGVIAGLAAVVGSIWYMKKLIDDVANSAKSFSQSMTGTSQKINEIAKTLNTKTWEQKMAEVSQSRVTGETASEATKTKAAEFIGTETGQAIVENIKSVMETSGQTGATQALKNQLERAVLSGAMPIKLANQVALEVGKSLGNTKLSVDVAAQMKEVFGPDGSSLKTQEGRLQIYADIFADLQDPNKLSKSVSEIWDQQGVLGKVLGGITGQGEATIMAEQVAGAVGEGMAALNQEYQRNLYLLDQGKISFQEFVDNQDLISRAAQDQRLGWEGAQKSLENYYAGSPEELSKALTAFKGRMLDQQIGIIKLEIDPQSQQDVIDAVNKTTMQSGGVVDAGEIGAYQQQIDQVTNALNLQKSALEEMEGMRGTQWFDELEYNRIKGEVNSLTQQLTDMQSLQDFSLDVSVALSAGTISPETLQALLVGKDADLQRKIKLTIGALPSDTAQNVLALLEMSEGDEATMDFIVNVAARGGKDLNQMYAVLQALKVANINPQVILDLPPADAQKALSWIYDKMVEFDKLPKNASKKRYAEFFAPNYEMTKEQMDAFMALPMEQKRYFTTVFTAFFAEGGSQAAKNFLIQKGLLTSATSGQVPAQAQQEWAADVALGDIITEEPTTPDGTTPSPTGGDTSGGGDKKETLLKDWLKSLIRQIQLYDDMKFTYDKLMNSKKALWKTLKVNRGLDDQLLKAGYSRSFVDLIMQQDPKIAASFLSKKKGYIGKNGEITRKGQRAEKIGLFDIGRQGRIDVAGRITEKQNLTKGQDILRSMGVSPDVIKAFGDDSQIMNSVVALKSAGKAGSKALQDLINKLVELQKLEADPIDDAIDNLTKAHDDLVEQIDEEIEGYEKQIDAINEQIDAIEKLNDADQERIDDLNRQKEMIQRQIDVLERANEMDQRKIDLLQREDELRQRTITSIQNELEIMSRQEEDIRSAYQKRIDALENVARINDRILQSQQDQLNISKALSEGDVYAAAQAAAEMQRNSVQFAADQNRAGLEQGMENQIGGLRTAGGLTRAQAEAQIQAIQDQSYQTQLQIQAIQDVIYQRNLEIIPLKDAQYQLDLAIRDIDDIIYARQQEINLLEKDIAPLEDRITAQNKIKDALDSQLEAQVKQLEAARDNVAATNEQIAAADALAKQWASVQNMIAEANKTANDNRENKVKAPQRETYDSDKAWRDAIAVWKEDIEATRQAKIAAAKESIKKYAGGVISRYSTGSVVGAGARDSVSAMLTPGEYVIRKAMVDKYGLPFFENINQGSYSMPTYSGTKAPSTKFAAAQPSQTTVAPVYNTYSVNVNASTNASPDDIANTVINKIRSIDSMSVRRINGY